MSFPTTLFGYIGRHFLIWFTATFAVISALMFMGDVVELVRRTSSLPDVPLSVIVEIAALKQPASAEQVTPFAILFGSILALWRLTRSHELVVARAAGVSVWQFLLPAIVLAFLGGVIGVTAFNPIASALNATRAQLENATLHRQSEALVLTGSGLWLRQGGGGGTQAVIHSVGLHQPEMRLDQATMLFFDADDRLVRRIDAPTAQLDGGRWHFAAADEWMPNLNTARHFERLDVPTDLTESKIEESFAAPDTLSFWSLPGFIDLLERSGFSADKHRLYFDSLLARPLLMCAMVLIAAVFSLRLQRRGGTAAMLFGGVAAGFMLYFLQAVAYALGQSSTIPVALAAWAPAGVSTLLGATVLLHLEDG
jgi:lipopolysaccharide export system permease protein